MEHVVGILSLLNMGPMEWAVIAGIALLIFGKRLPEVARSMGRGVVEFKRGLSGVEDAVDQGGKPAPQADPKSLPASGTTLEEPQRTTEAPGEARAPAAEVSPRTSGSAEAS